ncbi:uncharacterized protein MYCFIDRAFT_87432 [Pseudocercospora fijiensis CIRAD86]|uniref:DUF2406 domain-containing protein n=1 Tax=Pseudocercospora fijiensis (strain CIRAD86) TaxID=383855 RepID=M2ZJ76_PSEFD|nr:uncharacterized protein MYCFIDRAFT_87432 [Pseudocercospora fijiensis CIRAD86]EME79149.1 hypothetical protein MYCFIDRAFT_87432 [Pseudocercospora fijiensis CIRAD86]
MADPRPHSPHTSASRPHASRSRTFSFRSDKSGASQPKEHLVESPKEKQRRDSIWKSTSKANPNAALVEAQPGGIQHKDAYGNPITDPDLANPTRPRMERPLDTIRSFEAAIDSGYKRRSTFMRSESDNQMGGGGGGGYAASGRNSSYGEYTHSFRRMSVANRRMSGFGDGPSPNNRYAYGNGGGGGYYGGQRDSHASAGPSARPRYGRGMQSDPMMQARPYPPQHGYQHSQDTMNTAHGSDSTGPWNSGTDPSSENSSIDKNYQNGQQNGYHNGYGANGFSGPIPEEGGAYPVKPGYGGAPAVLPPNARRPIPLGNSDGMPVMPNSGLPSAKRPEPEKRKSWLKRRFSKKD